MMNEELVDPKDLIIGKLKRELEKKNRAIEQFKNYDKNRKEYYSRLAIKVGELEAYVAELEAGDEAMNKMKEKCIRLSKEVSILQAKVGLTKYDVEEVALVTTLNKVKMKRELEELHKKVKEDKVTRDRLLYIINQYREKYGDL